VIQKQKSLPPAGHFSFPVLLMKASFQGSGLFVHLRRTHDPPLGRFKRKSLSFATLMPVFIGLREPQASLDSLKPKKTAATAERLFLLSG
jgi:hypothetical protein